MSKTQAASREGRLALLAFCKLQFEVGYREETAWHSMSVTLNLAVEATEHISNPDGS